MAGVAIQIFSEDVNFVLKQKKIVKGWLLAVIQEEGFILDELNFIFCSDEYLLRMNQEYLDHDTYTDVITFDNSEGGRSILGDIFISIDRIKENAHTHGVSLRTELCRVMVHGTLHLLGYKDKTKAAKQIMIGKEDYYLQKLVPSSESLKMP